MARSKSKSSMSASISEEIARRTNNGQKLVEFATRLLEDEGQSMVDRRWAAEWLADRGAGKAPTVVETEHTIQLSDGTDLSQLSDADLAALGAGLQQRALESGEPDAPAEVVE